MGRLEADLFYLLGISENFILFYFVTSVIKNQYIFLYKSIQRASCFDLIYT